tara:strand:- start:380 stop:649 length:270 start_codon:yes stop_codon:yes gene_type:complete
LKIWNKLTQELEYQSKQRYGAYGRYIRFFEWESKPLDDAEWERKILLSKYEKANFARNGFIVSLFDRARERQEIKETDRKNSGYTPRKK